MNRNHVPFTTLLLFSAAILPAIPGAAGTVAPNDPNNVALLSDGASFVAASSIYQRIPNVTEAENSPISGSPTYRYVFQDGVYGAPQTYEIKLGASTCSLRFPLPMLITTLATLVGR